MFLSSFWLGAQCTYSKTIDIPDEGESALSFLVSNAVKNKLGIDNELCGVSIKFKHEGLGDLNISIISPAGQLLQLVGPGGSIANTTDGTTWDINFVQCSGTVAAEPDPGISASWDNGEVWGLFQTYTGSYYPFGGCLEDLNTGTVNGTWTLLFEDAVELDTGIIESVTIYFCDEDLTCNLCSPPAAQPLVNNIEHCQGTDFFNGELNYKFSLANSDTINYRLTYAVFSKNNFSGLIRDTSITTFDTGQYKLCLLTYALSDSLSLPQSLGLKNETLYNNAIQDQGVCAILNGCINLNILPVSDTLIKKFELCEGEFIFQNGIKFDKEGSFYITSTSGKCDSIINIWIDKIDLKINFTKSKPILTCIDNTIKITSVVNENKALTYRWFTKDGNIAGLTDGSSIDVKAKGTYYLEVSYNNCKRLDSIAIAADVTIPSIDLSALPITCSMPETTVKLTTLSTLIAADWTGPAFTKIGNSIQTSNVGTYTVTVIDDKNCEATASITITDNLKKPAMNVTYDHISCKMDSVKITLVDSFNIASLIWQGGNVTDPTNLNNYFSKSGIYYLALTGYNGCTDSLMIDIKDETYTINVVVNPDTIDCFKFRALLTPITTFKIESAKWFFPSGDSIVVDELQTPIPGLYSLVVIDSNNCKGSTQVLVTKDTLAPSLTVSNKVLSCNPDSVQLYADDFNPEYNYLWYNSTYSSSLDSPFVQVAGIYTVLVTDKNSCSAQKTLTVIPDLALPNVAFNVDTLKCGAQFALLTPSDTLGYDFKWEAPSTMVNTDVDPYGKVTRGGTYTVEVKNRISGCNRVYELLVNDIRNYPVFTLLADTIGCTKDSVQINFTSTLPFTSTQWQGPTFTSPQNKPFVKSPGLYYLTVTDKDGCVFFDSINVRKNLAIPVITTQTNTITCDTAAVTISASILDVSPSYQWVFNNKNIGTASDLKVNLPGVYKVTAKNNRGCEASSDVIVNADTIKPKLTILPFGRLDCRNQEITITGNANEVIAIHNFTGPGIVSQANNVVTVNKAGTYTLSVKDLSSCTNEINFSIEDSARYINVTNLIQNISCDSIGKISISLDLPADSIIWTGPTSVPLNQSKFSSNKSGTYNYKVISKDGCITTGMLDLMQDTISPKFVKIISDTLDCNNLSVNIGLETVGPIKSVSWNGLPDKTLLVSVFLPKLYSGSVTGLNGCNSKFSINVIEDKIPPLFTLKGDTINCRNSKVDLELLSTQALSLTTWTTPDKKTLNGKKVKVEKPGKYYVIAKGLNGCEKRDSIDIVDNLTKPKIDLQDTFLLPCNFSPIKLSVSSNDSLIDYRWSGIDKPFVSTDKNPSISETIIIKLFTAGTNGCSVTDTTIVVLDTNKPKFGFINDTIKCKPSFASLIALDIADDKSIKWIDGSGKISLTDTLMVNKAGTYKLLVEGKNFCKDSVVLIVPIDTIRPSVSLLALDSFYCQIKTVKLEGKISSQDSIVYVWDTKNGNFVDNSTLTAVIDKAGTYYLTATNPFSSCASSDSLSVVYDNGSKLKFDLSFESPVCLGENTGKIKLFNIQNAFGSVEIQLNEKPFGTIQEFDQLTEGKYRLSIQDSLGCKKDTIINLLSGFYFDAILPSDTLIDLGQSIDLAFTTIPPIGNFQKIEWKSEEELCLGCLTYKSTPSEDVLIKIEIIDSLGCRNQDSILIAINSIPLVDLPNIIKLGSGNENGIYTIPHLLAFKRIQLFEIYDSWGNILHRRENFEPGDAQMGWDGTFRGQKVNPGVFVVNFIVELNNGKIKQYVKDVTVVH